MSRKQRISQRLSEQLEPVYLEVNEETQMHNVPADAESHFRVVVVSSRFEGLTPVARQRLVNQLVADEFANGMHAFSVYTWTPQQWVEKGGQAPNSPPCLGGSKEKR
jgi:BolA protein